MLHFWHHPQTGETRLYIRGVSAEAWIASAQPRGDMESRHGQDWVLWVRSGRTLILENCPARLLVQSLLRAWLLQRYRRPLFTLSFGELCDIARRSEVRALR
jgi:hypothetical protein